MINKLLISTDLDRTLIPNGEAKESDNARFLFSQLVAKSEVTLTYVTGRDQLLVKEAIAQYQLPIPNYVITDVGSSIYKIEDSKWIREKNWSQKIGLHWQNKHHDDLIPLFADLKPCGLQEKTKQGLHKLSYYISLDHEIEPLMKEIHFRLEKNQIQSNLIWSIDEEINMGLLDILPISANKRHAMEYLMEKEDFNLENTVFSGDSGNDLDVLISPIKSILVANAHEEVKEKVKLYLETTDDKDSVYIAKGGYLNMNGNYSAGILEGIYHYFPIIYQDK